MDQVSAYISNTPYINEKQKEIIGKIQTVKELQDLKVDKTTSIVPGVTSINRFSGIDLICNVPEELYRVDKIKELFVKYDLNNYKNQYISEPLTVGFQAGTSDGKVNSVDRTITHFVHLKINKSDS